MAATTREYSPNNEDVGGILQRYFDIYLPANLEDQIEEKGNNPFLSVNGMMDMTDQNDINNARNVLELMEGYFKDISNPKNYDYFMVDGVGQKKYIFQKSGAIIGTRVTAGIGGQNQSEQKYAFENDNPIMSLSDVISEKGPTYLQARDIDYDRHGKYRTRIVTRHQYNSEGNVSVNDSLTVTLTGEEVSKYYMEFPILIMRNSTPMSSRDLEALKRHSSKVRDGKLELEVSVSPYTVLYIDPVPDSERRIKDASETDDMEDIIASEKGRFSSRMDFYVRGVDGLVSDILAAKNEEDTAIEEVLEAIKDIFFVGQDIRLLGTHNSYEIAGAIEKIFIDSGNIKIRVKAEEANDAFKMEPIIGVKSVICGLVSSNTRVRIASLGSEGKHRRDESKSKRNSKGSVIKAENLYSAVENRSDALNDFKRQFMGPDLVELAKEVNGAKVEEEQKRREAAEKNRRAYRYTSTEYYQPPIDYQDILIEGFNSLATAFTGQEISAVTRKFNEQTVEKLKADRDRFFESLSFKVVPKENTERSLNGLYSFDAARIRYLKAYDLAAVTIGILYNPFTSHISNGFGSRGHPEFRSSNGRLNIFDLAGIKIGLRVVR